MGLDARTAATLRCLLFVAGIGAEPDWVRPLEGIGAMNRHWRVRVGGRDLVLREYGWPFLPPAPPRARREAAVLDLLEEAGVPAPRALAIGDDALLATFERGEVLGEVVADGRNVPAGAWRDIGRAWRRVHDIVPTGQLRAALLGGPQREVEGWFERVRADVDAHLWVGACRRPELAVDADRVQRLVAAARPVLEQRPVRLLHGDAHLWNVLVEAPGDRCAAILDWECAEAGDPLWDVVGLDLLQRREVGPLPAAFLAGYGDPGPPLVRGLYELVVHLWQATDVEAWPTPLPSHRAADAYLRALPHHLTRLERLLHGHGGASRAARRAARTSAAPGR